MTVSSLPPLEIDPLPKIDLRHLFVLTDDTGILQHATMATPDLHHGYCTDDNARALIAAAKVLALPESDWTSKQTVSFAPDNVVIAMQRYLAFLAYAFNPETERFRNFMQYDRTWLEETGSEDSHARTLWALGKTIRLAPNDDIRRIATQIMDRAMPAAGTFRHIRPWAYALLGLEEYLRCKEDDQARALLENLSQRLYDVWLDHADGDWPWWHDHLTWGNAKLPHALLVAGFTLMREDLIDTAIKSLRWLLKIQTAPEGHLSIIGNAGWYFRGKPIARFDQQPIEAKSLVQACLACASATADDFWTHQASRCFAWFTGANDLATPLYNPDTGGGFDGLHAEGVNSNQGAESTLAYLLSVLELHHYEWIRREHQGPA
jgi:hypothetical protein